MKFAAALLLLPALAVADDRFPPEMTYWKANSDGDYKWRVSGWSAGCARSGCYYDFNVTSHAVKGAKGKDHSNSPGGLNPPWFMAYCSGGQDWFRECKVLKSLCDGEKYDGCGVSARLVPDPNDPSNATIGVSYQWTQYQDPQNTPRWNLTGYNQSTFNQFVSPLEHFDIYPTQANGVD